MRVVGLAFFFLFLYTGITWGDEAVSVTGLRNTVDKSYRKMVAGMDLFEKMHGLAPDARLRFKLLPRKRETNMEDVQVEILGDSFETPVPVAPDRTFVLPRDPQALKEDASVRPNRKKQTMTWRSEIRSPGVPAGKRRLGDLRLECAVGMAAGVVSNDKPLFGRLAGLLTGGPEYCAGSETRYLFFAERPIFAVTLVSGERREVLPIDRLYMGASYNPDWKADLAYCDCEVLLDRTYTLPLGDKSWPDDALVEFEYMGDAPR
jgi:hypothetical protein